MIVVSFQLKGQVYTVTAPNPTANTMVKYRQRHGYLSVDERMGSEIQAGNVYVTSVSYRQEMEAIVTKASNHAEGIKAAETQVAAVSQDLNKAYEEQAGQIKGAFKEVREHWPF